RELVLARVRQGGRGLRGGRRAREDRLEDVRVALGREGAEIGALRDHGARHARRSRGRAARVAREEQVLKLSYAAVPEVNRLSRATEVPSRRTRARSRSTRLEPTASGSSARRRDSAGRRRRA